jgi:hypothetical protein
MPFVKQSGMRENLSEPDALGRFRLLACAIAGCTVELARSELGSLAWTDGITIFVGTETTVHDQLRSIAVQASLLGAGSLRPEVIARLSRRPALARRYLTMEGHRALHAQEPFLPAAARSILDTEIAARSNSPEESLGIAMSRAAIAAPPPEFGTILAKRIRTSADRPLDASSDRHAPGRSREDMARELADGDDSPVIHLLSSPVGGGGPIGRLLKRLLGDARSQGGGPPGADPATHSTSRSDRVASNAAVTTATPPLFDETGVVSPRRVTYPEWDVFHRRYRPNWCTVVEVPQKPDNGLPLTPPGGHDLHRPLARLGMDLARRHRQLQGDDIDIDATVEAFVEAAAGTPPDEAIYVDSQRCRPELSVLLLLDTSGSAGEPGTSGGTIHDHQRAAAVALLVALHDLGDRVALLGFRSHGRSAVEVSPLKHFDENLDAAVLRRIGSLVPRAYTRLGAAIRHAANMLETGGGTSRRLLVVLSDGFAYDHGYEGTYGEADARRALAEARRRGTACLCLSIAAGTDVEALRRVFGSAAHARIPREDQLAGVVGPLFRSALRSTEAQRLAWQRRERTRERLRIERSTA